MFGKVNRNIQLYPIHFHGFMSQLVLSFKSWRAENQFAQGKISKCDAGCRLLKKNPARLALPRLA
jgi:hypothetical protein